MRAVNALSYQEDDWTERLITSLFTIHQDC